MCYGHTESRERAVFPSRWLVWSLYEYGVISDEGEEDVDDGCYEGLARQSILSVDNNSDRTARKTTSRLRNKPLPSFIALVNSIKCCLRAAGCLRQLRRRLTLELVTLPFVGCPTNDFA